MSSPTHRLGDVLVVFDGPRRLLWNGPDDGRATPVALWPDPAQRSQVEHHLAQQAPLLVVIDHDRSPVRLLCEEVATLPPALTPLLRENQGLAELDIPLLDWLPEPLRTRGVTFLHQARAHRAATPRPLLPDLLVEDRSCGPVRIALRTSPRPLAEHELASTIEHLFGPHAQPALSAVDTLTGPITTGHRT